MRSVRPHGPGVLRCPALCVEGAACADNRKSTATRRLESAFQRRVARNFRMYARVTLPLARMRRSNVSCRHAIFSHTIVHRRSARRQQCSAPCHCGRWQHLTPLGGRDSGPGINAVWGALNLAGGLTLLVKGRRGASAQRHSRTKRWNDDLPSFETGCLVFAAWMVISERLMKTNQDEGSGQ